MTFPLFSYINKIHQNPFAFKSVIPLVFMTLLLSACATTSEPLHFSPVRSAVMQDALENEESKLANLSYNELLVLGNQYLSTGNTKLALLHFQMALKKQDGSTAAYTGLGETLALSGDNQAAHSFFDKALLIDGKNRQVLISTGKLYREERNYEQAVISFNRAREIHSDDPEILTELAITYGRMGKEDKAHSLLIQVTELRPRDASAFNNLGFNYLLRNNYAEAVKTLQTALAIEPDSLRIQNNLAAAYALDTQAKKAFNLFRKTGSEATAYNDLGYIYMIMGQEDTARASFEKALELHPRHYVRAKENLGLLGNEP
ncbi:MAG: tetratricopeptide repeat protein [Thermodesulfobacteriota bacterium]